MSKLEPEESSVPSVEKTMDTSKRSRAGSAEDKKETLSSSSKGKDKDELHVLDQKIAKCTHEIQHLKQKLQKEWSKSMTNHLKNFYAEDVNLSKSSQGGGGGGNDSGTTNASSAEFEKKIQLLTKKLAVYDKRRLKVLEDKAAEKAASLAANTTTATTTTLPTITGETLQHQEPPLISITGASQPSMQALNPNVLPLAARNRLQRPTINNGASTNDMLQKQQLAADINNVQDAVDGALTPQATDEQQLKPPQPPSFYTNPDMAASMARFNAYKEDNNNAEFEQQDQFMNNKFLQNVMIHYEQEFNYLKLQQEKILNDIDEVQKKMQENFQQLSKEILKNNQQMQEPMHNLSFHFFKRLDELKTPLDRIQALGYALTHCHDDVKECKEDVISIKNRIEIIEKTQKGPGIDASPTSYYQLFYKFLDIILTLTTIVLLAVTHVISSVKFVIMLYPRVIVLFLLIYFMFYMFVDYELFDEYFYNFLVGINVSDLARAEKSAMLRNDTLMYLHNTNLTMTSRIIYGLYKLFSGRHINATSLINSLDQHQHIHEARK